jgi:hypothetical protein
MVWPSSVASCQSPKTRPGGGVLQLGTGPDLSGFGSAALDVGRCGLLQDPGMQARVRERAVSARTERGSSVRTTTGPNHGAPETQHRYLLDAGGADDGIAGPAEIEPTPIVCSSATQSALDRSVVRCSTKNSAIGGTVTEAASTNSRRGNRRGGAR